MDVALGIDVGGTKILGVVTNEAGELLGEVNQSTPQEAVELLDAVESSVRGLASELSATAVMRGVGIALPGLLDTEGTLHETPNIPAASGLRARDELTPRVWRALRHPAGGVADGLMLVLENDGTAAAAGELAFGAARECRDAVVVALGTGIGGGIIANGRVIRGGRGFAGEFGHMVVEVDGPPCVCGGRGCWEQFVSGSGLARLARLEAAAGRTPELLAAAGGDPASIRGELVIEAARRGSKEVEPVLEVFARYLAMGASNLAEILDPGEVMLGGGLVLGTDVYFERMLEHYARTRRGSGPHSVPITLAALGPRAGALGVAALALGVRRTSVRPDQHFKRWFP